MKRGTDDESFMRSGGGGLLGGVLGTSVWLVLCVYSLNNMYVPVSKLGTWYGQSVGLVKYVFVDLFSSTKYLLELLERTEYGTG